jgi:Protein of unknown function (DUF2924)
MPLNVDKEVARLGQMTVAELQSRYAELFGEPTRTGHRAWLFKRLAWRLQALAEGDLSERARQRARELACEADLRLSPPQQRTSRSQALRTFLSSASPVPDDRLPPAGTVLVRKYKGEALQVKVLPDGFAYQGETYDSLSAVAEAITGSHCNGFLFFRLGRKEANS